MVGMGEMAAAKPRDGQAEIGMGQALAAHLAASAAPASAVATSTSKTPTVKPSSSARGAPAQPPPSRTPAPAPPAAPPPAAPKPPSGSRESRVPPPQESASAAPPSEAGSGAARFGGSFPGATTSGSRFGGAFPSRFGGAFPSRSAATQRADLPPPLVVSPPPLPPVTTAQAQPLPPPLHVAPPSSASSTRALKRPAPSSAPVAAAPASSGRGAAASCARAGKAAPTASSHASGSASSVTSSRAAGVLGVVAAPFNAAANPRKAAALQRWRELLRTLVSAYPDPEAAAQHLELRRQRAVEHEVAAASGAHRGRSAARPAWAAAAASGARRGGAGGGVGGQAASTSQEEAAWELFERAGGGTAPAAPEPAAAAAAAEQRPKEKQRGRGRAIASLLAPMGQPLHNYRATNAVARPGQQVRTWELGALEALEDAWTSNTELARQKAAEEEAELRAVRAAQLERRQQHHGGNAATGGRATAVRAGAAADGRGGRAGQRAGANRGACGAGDVTGGVTVACSGRIIGAKSSSSKSSGGGSQARDDDDISRLLDGRFMACDPPKPSRPAQPSRTFSTLPPRLASSVPSALPPTPAAALKQPSPLTAAELLALQKEREARAHAAVKRMHAAAAADTVSPPTGARLRLLPDLGTVVRDPAMAVPLLRAGVLGAVRRLLQTTGDLSLTKPETAERLRLSLFGVLRHLGASVQPLHLRQVCAAGCLIPLIPLVCRDSLGP